jgi:hypothetical protein
MRGVPCFCVSFALDWSSNIEIVDIECPNVVEVLHNLEQRFPVAYDGMTICAIVEYRQPDDTENDATGVMHCEFASQ